MCVFVVCVHVCVCPCLLNALTTFTSFIGDDHYPTTIGAEKGKYYAVNFPLRDGIDDEMIFKPVMSKVMEIYRPSAVVLQCGTDSLAGDRLGCFNLSLKGEIMCCWPN